eukprot:scaffold134441_cov69-Attheya_sp.AAC.1
MEEVPDLYNIAELPALFEQMPLFDSAGRQQEGTYPEGWQVRHPEPGITCGARTPPITHYLQPSRRNTFSGGWNPTSTDHRAPSSPPAAPRRIRCCSGCDKRGPDLRRCTCCKKFMVVYYYCNAAVCQRAHRKDSLTWLKNLREHF